MRLTRLTLKDFAPFADGEMLFPELEAGKGLAEVHLFTGENGTGKTRVLAALMASLGNIGPLRDRVRQDSGAELGVSCEWNMGWKWENGDESPKTPSFPIQLDIMEHVHAMGGSGIALLEEGKAAAGAELKPARAHEYLTLGGAVGGGSLFQRLLHLRMGVALERDSMSSPGEGGRLALCLGKLEGAVREITGHDFALHVQQGREMRLVVQWDEQRLYFGELPDGLRSLLNWLAGWVVLQAEYFESSLDPLGEPVTLLLDEPENHLHPAWQRRVLPAVQRLFPEAQMFVVTHSPFVVSSLNEGWIHKFTRQPDGRVKIQPAQKASRGDSYMTAVQEVLDLMEWFDPETEEEISEFEKALDRAYTSNGSSVDEMRRRAEKLASRSTEVNNLVAGLVAQFDRSAAKKRAASK